MAAPPPAAAPAPAPPVAAAVAAPVAQAPVAQVPVPVPRPASIPMMVATAAAPSSSAALVDAFRRLVEPERTPPLQASGSRRLHFNYHSDSPSPRLRQPAAENLEDVFSRISGPRRTR
jgi:hypothetical protein